MAISYQRKLGDGTIVIDSGTSNVGIGTNDPGAKLEISDTTTGIGAIISNTTHNSRLQIYTIAVGKNSEIWFGDAADDDIGKIDYDHANNSLAFFTNASERMRIASGGSVGIGTTNPPRKLSVETNDTATYSASVNASEISIARKNSSNTAGQVAAISLNATGWSGQTTGVVVLNAIARQGNFSNADFAIQNRVGGNFVETFRITTYGNVGIGTDTPDDNVNTGSYFKPDGGGRFLTVKDSSGSFIMLESSTTTDDDQIGGIYFNNTGGQADANVHVAGIDAILHKHGTNDALSGGDLRFFTKPSGSGVNGPRMVILQNGNVGIGTTSPSYKLQVDGNVGITEYLQHSGDNNTYLRFSGDMVRLAAGGVEMIRLHEDATQDTLVINEGGADVDFRVESDTDTHALFVQGSDGNVGIGTNSPEAKLHIIGGHLLLNNALELRSKDTSGNIKTITRVNSSNELEYGWSGAGAVKFMGGGSYTERMRIHTNGNIGIGTTSPATDLSLGNATHTSPDDTDRILNWYASTGGSEITNASHYITVGQNSSNTSQPKSVGLALFNPNTANNTYSPAITFGGLSTSGDYMTGAGAISTQLIANADDNNFRGGDLTFYTSGTTSATRGLNEKMRITSSGSVGIGTTSPAEKLDVRGGADIYDSLTVGKTNVETSTTNYENVLRVRGKNNYSDGTTWYGTYGQILLHTTSNMTSSARRFLITNALHNNKFAIVRSVDANTDPVVNSTASGSTPNSGTADFVIDNSGNVGIGTTSPDAPLHVSRSTSGINQYIYNSSSGQAYIALGNATTGLFSQDFTSANGMLVGVDSDETAVIWNAENTRLRFGTNNSERLSITGAGSVGIGTTSPDSTLHVSSSSPIITISNSDTSIVDEQVIGQIDFKSLDGSTNMTNVFGSIRTEAEGTLDNGVNDGGKMVFSTFKQSTTLVDQMVIDRDGNVGIGTTSPGDKLHIKGGFRIEDGATTSKFNLNFLDANTLDFILEPSDDTTPNVFRFRGNSQNESAGLRVYDRYENDYISLRHNAANAFIETDSDSIYISPEGNQALKVEAGGNVGIGITSPGAKLDVNSGISTSSSDVIKLSQATNGAIKAAASLGISIQNGGESTNAADLWFTTATGGSLSERMRITSGGNVGIGTTNPTNKLDVRGLSRLNALSLRGGTDNYAHLSRFSWRDTNSSSSGTTWKKVCGVSIGAGNYSALSMEVVHYYPGSNHGNSASLSKHYYSISFRRSSGTQDNQDNAIVYGRDANFIRVVRTALGEFELQARANGSHLSYSVDITQTGGNSDAITMVENSSTNGNTTGTIYTAVSSSNTAVNLPGSLGAGSNVYLNHSGHSFLNGGNVGIGTTTPDAPLTVHSSTDPEIRFGYSSTQDHRIQWDSSKVFIHADPENANASSAIALYVDGGAKLYIPDSGNVGIGSTAPAAKLNVASTGANAYSSTITKGTNMKGIINVLSNNADDMVGVYFGTGTTSEGTHWSGITGSRSQSATDWSTQLNFYTHNEDVANITTATQKMVIKGNGNVGIGTTSPSARLHVNGSAETLYLEGASSYTTAKFRYGGATKGEIVWYNTQSALYMQNMTGGPIMFYQDSSERLRINTGGNVGIGTTSPSHKLTVYTDATSGVELVGQDGGNQNSDSSKIIFNGHAQANGPFIQAINTSAYGIKRLGFFANRTASDYTTLPTESMSITNTGNVGIGRTSPSYRLTVDNDDANTNNPALYVKNPNSSTSAVIAEFAGDSDSIQIKNIGTGDYAIYNSQQDNGITLFDGSGGVEIKYAGTTTLESDSTGGIKVTGQLSATGDVVAYSSDKRLKENIKPIENAVDKIKQLKGVTFDWNERSEELGFEPSTKTNDVGVIAQDVEAVFPQLVHLAPFDIGSDEEGKATSKTGEDYKTVNYARLTAVLIEAVKEQQQQIDELKAKIDGITK